jgi:hypothetical protein
LLQISPTNYQTKKFKIFTSSVQKYFRAFLLGNIGQDKNIYWNGNNTIVEAMLPANATGRVPLLVS